VAPRIAAAQDRSGTSLGNSEALAVTTAGYEQNHLEQHNLEAGAEVHVLQIISAGTETEQAVQHMLRPSEGLDQSSINLQDSEVSVGIDVEFLLQGFRAEAKDAEDQRAGEQGKINAMHIPETRLESGDAGEQIITPIPLVHETEVFFTPEEGLETGSADVSPNTCLPCHNMQHNTKSREAYSAAKLDVGAQPVEVQANLGTEIGDQAPNPMKTS
jgi:hypothetical protein